MMKRVWGTGPRVNPVVAIQKARLRFRRSGPARLLSHIQQIDALRRALTLSTLAVARTASKKPRVKASFGPAIAVGYASEAEYCDVELTARLDPKTAAEALQPHLPDGYELIGLKSIPRFFPSLEESVNVVDYRVESPWLQGTLAAWENFARQDSFLIIKKKEEKDVVIDARPVVRLWSLENNTLRLQLRLAPGRTLKPERIIQAVCGLSDDQVINGVQSGELGVTRTHLYFEKDDGVLLEP